MTQRLKLGLGVAGFALLMIIAIAAYNLGYSRLNIKATEAAAATAGAAAPAAEADRQKAPDFSMLDKEGNTVKLSNLVAQGKPIVLNFWASWCPPCKIEMPDFDKVYKELGGEVQFMMVDLADGQRETVQKGIQYINDQQFSFPVFFDTNGEGSYAYGIRSIPTTIFIDKDGFMVTGARGAINERTLRRGIELISPR